MARKTKEALIEEARDLGLEVDEEESYNLIADRVRTSREAAENDEQVVVTPESEEFLSAEPETAEDADDESPSAARTCINCGQPAVVTDDGGGTANPVDLCRRHARRAV